MNRVYGRLLHRQQVHMFRHKALLHLCGAMQGVCRVQRRVKAWKTLSMRFQVITAFCLGHLNITRRPSDHPSHVINELQ